jgi:hypothetical protein
MFRLIYNHIQAVQHYTTHVQKNVHIIRKFFSVPIDRVSVSVLLRSSILEVFGSVLGGEPPIQIYIKYFAISLSLSKRILGHYFGICHDLSLRNPYIYVYIYIYTIAGVAGGGGGGEWCGNPGPQITSCGKFKNLNEKIAFMHSKQFNY